VTTARTAAALALVAVATLAAGVIALGTFSAERTLSVGTVGLSVDPGHRGALDLYVPVVDWGARFPVVRLPVRLKAEVRAVNRDAVTRLAEGQPVDVKQVRDQARDGVASYIRVLLVVVLLAELAIGALAAFAVRARTGPRLRLTLPTAGGTALVSMVLLIVLLPPRGEIARPEYYAHGPDIPRALQAIEQASTSSQVLDEELNAQLVGIARLVEAPARRRVLGTLPRFTLASDLHNNVLALPALEGAAGDGPLLFPGDLTDSGSPFETRLVRRVVHDGHPFVFVSGNHDSDVLMRQLANAGAIVLTQDGRLLPDGKFGPLIANVRGLRVAGYSDPFMRLRAKHYQRDVDLDPKPTPHQQLEFANWLRPLVGQIDVVMVHEPALAAQAIEDLRAHAPRRPLVIAVGHTHIPSVNRYRNLTVVDGGTIGAGGPTNLTDRSDISLARVVYALKPRFAPLAADLVKIDPDSGSATAERRRLDITP
jgi:Calcineurin-like phosphoesterase superfamily domain